ncbi:hypothetical protein [Mucilaginibacter sp. 44-25]|uniref:hypothetical protein n=1 Tax=Mucilaginibacter sp. 44-25 TaxID=1895794 RepID=UPI00095CC349|nr:hypothetical protein [Mucilaginibacter sp. 44-25]OJW17295.1 MAG: hypothetical protein BGO48_06990 [Mucilaginibacter sp. 44-25]
MKNYLSTEGAAFYHITRREIWENGIQQNGLIGDDEGRIFVSRSNDENVLSNIALNQILDPDEEPDLVVLKLTQATNQFKFEEFTFDHQATEITFPFHNIIKRAHIPLEHIEFESYIRVPLLELGRISNQTDAGLPGSAIFEEALDIIYEAPNRQQYKLQAVLEKGKWVFKKRLAW